MPGLSDGDGVKKGYIVFRDGKPMVFDPVDGSLYFCSFHSRVQHGPTIFTTRTAAKIAIRQTNAYDKRNGYGWAEAFGKPWILPCQIEESL